MSGRGHDVQWVDSRASGCPWLQPGRQQGPGGRPVHSSESDSLRFQQLDDFRTAVVRAAPAEGLIARGLAHPTEG